ncbi:MAG: ATP-dependent protease [Desulfobacca sp. 4484_104]|nr:MAG: ATP-dependent protease [Desulfobacca sp. 4484_104]RLA90065.1 MAG: ATP-dependent protease [Deltaproteobacteria bacterium]
MSRTDWELKPENLRTVCDPDSLGFETTAELEPLTDKVVAQYRARHALEFGLGMKDPEFNIFVVGLPRTGKVEMIKAYVDELASKEETPPDYVYVYNFKEPEKPNALKLPTGKGRELENDLNGLISTLKVQIPEVFESENYTSRREALVRKFNKERNAVLQELDTKAGAEGFILNVSQTGLMIVPGKDGKPMGDEELKALSDAEREELRQKSNALHAEMTEALHKIRKMEKEFEAEEKQLDQNIALYVVGHRIEELIEKYQGYPEVTEYLRQVEQDILKNIDDLKRRPGSTPTPFPIPIPEPSFVQYRVNVFVDHSATQGAPVVLENNPTYTNLFGGIERRAQFGALVTDFTLIRPGALHRANGGYLIMNSLDLLKWYFSYEALKRALKNQEIKIEDLGEQLGLITTKTLHPEPIPLKLKVILTGSPLLYQLLYTYDEDMHKLFKVKADFDWEMRRTPEHLQKFSAFLRSYCEKENLRPVHKTGAARLVEYASELVGHQEKLTLQLAEVAAVLKEANFWAGTNGHDVIRAEDMEKAIAEKIYRSDLPEEKLQEFIQEGMLTIETSGAVQGQVNGLSVYMLGDHAFARPSRITAAVSLGKEGVVTIDRESKLSGNIHTKGVMILSGYLKSCFAQDKPLTLSASLCFEQSYGMVEGDSASGAELLALLSCLAEVPLAQNIAVTGSISQRGEFQPIGGVNWKIEGFYKVCKVRGLDGSHGVIIPKANVQDLMLKKEVLDAVREGKFHVWAVGQINEALEIMTDLPAGQKLPEGGFEPGTINYRVDQKLRQMMETARELMKEEKGASKENE